jgi:hypothetical protein
MATVAEAVKVLSIETGEPEPFVSQIARNLLNNGVLPKTVGKRLSEVDSVNVSILLLAIYTATKFSDAAARALRYAVLQWDGEPDGLPFGVFLGKALQELQTRTDRRITINDSISVSYEELRIEIVTSYPLIILTSCPAIGEPAFEGPISFAEEPNLARFWPSNMPRRSVTIPGHVLFAVVSRLFGIAPPPGVDPAAGPLRTSSSIPLTQDESE